MPRRNKIALIAFSFFAMSLFFAAAAFAQVSGSDLKLTVSTLKDSYNFGEKIDLTMEAENVSGALIPFSFDDGCQMGFSVDYYNGDPGNNVLPVYNENLYPRNCDSAATQLELPDGQKALWTRSYDTGTYDYPVLAPGEYVLHAYLKGYEDEEFTNAPSTYKKFTVAFAADQAEGGICNWDSASQCNNNLGCYFKDEFFADSGVCLDIATTSSSTFVRKYSLTSNAEVYCEGTGGQYIGCLPPEVSSPDDPGSSACIETCECPAGYDWDVNFGCRSVMNMAKLCLETGGILLDHYTDECYCGEELIWDYVRGCGDGEYRGFNDIAGHWAETYIVSLAQLGIVKGYEDGGYHPDEYINRAELVKMALSAAGIDKDIAYFHDFLFEDLDDWQKPWVNAAFKAQIVQGYSDTVFAPAQNVTRAEALKIAMLAFKVEIPNTSTEWAFKDTVNHWGVSYINQAYLDFIISGREDGLFYPNDPITRAEAAKILKLLVEKYS